MIIYDKSDIHHKAKQFLEQECPYVKVKDIDWDNASDPGDSYNCIGFAVGDMKWWAPPLVSGGVRLNPEHHWPESVQVCEDDVDNVPLDLFIEAMKTARFENCKDGEWEGDYDKITIYHDEERFRHVAIHISPSAWKSKLGLYSDFEHAPKSIDCQLYGSGRCFMRRTKQVKSSSP